MSHVNPLNAELNPICHLLALLGAHHILHISRIRVKICKIIFNIISPSTTTFTKLSLSSGFPPIRMCDLRI